ncbi:MAG TPA: glycosyltransferase, partial [Sulfurimonas sp.]|uniref:glycosyltransferase n=1 Tax=Sulfurimonas sp. TaxID=2022749 RepID=UPI002C12EBA3
MRKNILEICLSPDLGGLELYMYKLSRYLNEHSKVIALINKNGRLKNSFEKSGIAIEELKRKSFFSLFLNAFKIAKIIDKNGVDLVHIHWNKDIPVVVLAKTLSKRKPKIVQTRHMHMTRFKSDFYHKWLYKNIDLMIGVTNRVVEQIKKFVPADIRPKVVTSYIGASNCCEVEQSQKEELQKKYDIKPDSFVVGIVGRIEEPKGQYLLIEAIKKLKEKGISIKGLIIGHAMD